MSKSHARTHDDNRLTICLLCFRRTKTMFVIKKQLKVDIEKLFPNYVDDNCIPGALCSSCKRDVYRVKSGEKENIIFPDMSKFTRYKTKSQNNSQCQCQVCELARKPQAVYFSRGKQNQKQPSSEISNKKTPSMFIKCRLNT